MFYTKIADKIKAHILYSITFFFFFSPPENRAGYVIISKNMVEPERPQMTIWRMRVTCWIIKATCAQAHTPALLPTPTPPPHTHTHTATEICNTYCFFTAAVVS
jgi:hypothetical protein